MRTLFRLAAAFIIFLAFFYATTAAMSLLYALDAAPLAF